MAQQFYKLDIWKKGYDLLMEIYEITGRFPIDERFVLTSQSIRFANGIIANIAEAHGRYHFADKIRIMYITRGELEEMQSHLRVAFSRKYINKDKFDILDNEYERLRVGVNGYIQYLQGKKILNIPINSIHFPLTHINLNLWNAPNAT